MFIRALFVLSGLFVGHVISYGLGTVSGQQLAERMFFQLVAVAAMMIALHVGGTFTQNKPKYPRQLEKSQKITRLLDDKNEIVLAEDGFYVWWPAQAHGFCSADDLRIIADELDKRNKEWEQEVIRGVQVGRF